MAVQSRAHILVIEDDPDTCANLRDILELDDYLVETAGTAAAALQRADWTRYAAILLDRKLPDGSAEELLPRLHALTPDTAVLVVTGFADLEGAIAALRLGAADYILKPINPEALRASLARVAELRRLARAKERSDAAFRTLVEAAPCMILSFHQDHTIAYFSPFAEELTGYAAERVLGKDYFTLFVPEAYQPLIKEEVQRVFAGTPSRGYETPILCRDGSRRWIVWNAQRLDEHEGQPVLLAVGQDITQLKRAQEQAVQTERLAAIGQMMAGLAHESGNALARSQACLEMLTWEVQDQPEALDLIARIQKAQDHLKQLYEDVRNYAAPIRLEPDVWELDVIWRQAWENLALRRQGRATALSEATNGLDLHCQVDSFRLEQVFRNMFENSLAACADPVRIVIQAASAHYHDRPGVQITVQDNGPGLTSEQRQRIFDPFFTTKTKGTGLGMAIAKRIVEAHGGHLAVGPALAGGAEIVLTLPREVP